MAAYEKLIPIEFPPGIYANGTAYQARGRYRDSNLVRWDEGKLSAIGGWVALKTTAQADVTVTGFARKAHAWRGNDGGRWLAIGTSGKAACGSDSRLYAFTSGTLTDITPADLVDGTCDGAYSGAGAYGRGAYGLGVYGKGAGGLDLTDADTWSLDNFGDHLVGVLTSDKRVLEWDRNPVNDAAPVAGGPAANQAVVVTPEHFLFALGSTSFDGGSQNFKLVRWPDQATTTLWDPTVPGSQAGEFELNTAGRILTGRAGRRQTLIWTDVDLHGATYIGGELVYAFERLGADCGLVGPNAVTVVEAGVAYWMSVSHFFKYDGVVRPIPCEVSDFVFGDLNVSQRHKIVAVSNSRFSEITWYYVSTSGGGSEPDRYVTYNYHENHWSIGLLARSAGFDAGAFEYPVLVAPTGGVFEHERGFDHDGAVPFVESAPFEIDDGDRVLDVQTMIADEITLGAVQTTFFVAFGPNDPETTFGPYTHTTPRTDVRFTGRQVRVRHDEVAAGDWRIGRFRLGGVLGGYR